MASTRRRGLLSGTPRTDPIYFLMNNVDGRGGIARTVGNLASELAERHRVEIISLYRRQQKPTYPLSPRVKVRYLVEARSGKSVRGVGRVPLSGPSWLQRLDRYQTRLAPTSNEPLMSAMTDWLLIRAVRSLEPGVLISTRPSMTSITGRFAPRRLLTVGQDHLNIHERLQHPELMRVILDGARALDCFALLTEADAVDYRERLGDVDTLVTAMPNALPWPVRPASPLTEKIVISGGRLVNQKGFDLLIRSYEQVARARPDWQLHIYGSGVLRPALQRLITQLGLDDQVQLKGHTENFDSVLATASVYALSSRYEGFGMVLIEAMSRGLPLVSFDCPRGPGEIVNSGSNGVLVPPEDTDALGEAILTVIEDDELRTQMGKASHADAHQYEVETVARRWEDLLEQLLQRRQASARGR
jgi:glycosyltransferase involved in cell wall biosynthesis